MKLLLTSFGTTHLSRVLSDTPDIFYRMPPVSMSTAGQTFMPDYVTLLLASKIIIDELTYEMLVTHRRNYFEPVAKMIKRLYEEGFVQIENFDKVIRTNTTLLTEMLERDLKSFDLWINPLKESTSSWEIYLQNISSNLRNENFGERMGTSKSINPDLENYQRQMHYWLHDISAHIYDNKYRINAILNSSTLRRKAENRKILMNILTDYLSYVNSNILLSETFESGFHDWADFKPFYKEKFLSVAKQSAPGSKEIENIKKLFEISFPEFSDWQPNNIIKALKDKRIQELRQLIDSACKGEVEFDRDFANRALSEVFKIESGMTKFRNVVSYLTMPLGFIPAVGTPIQKITEEIITRSTEAKKRKGFQWFYMISELAQIKTKGNK